MKKLTNADMKKISGGLSGGCVDGGFCTMPNHCNSNVPPGAVDWFCDTPRRTCVYCF